MKGEHENIDWEALGRTLRDRREKLGIPSDVAAHQLCLNKHQILALENGSSTSFPGAAARFWCAQRYAAKLGISLDACAHEDAVTESPDVNVADAAPGSTEGAKTIPESSLIDSETLGNSGAGFGKKTVVMGFLLLIATLIFGLTKLTEDKPPAPVVEVPAPPPVISAAAIPLVEPPVPPAPEPLIASVPEIKPEELKPTPVWESKPQSFQQAVEVLGIDLNKSPKTIYVIPREPAVLVTKHPGKGESTLNLDNGVSQRIFLTGNETLRVAQGKDLDMYFQGRKVSSDLIEGGSWIRFVPLKEAATP